MALKIMLATFSVGLGLVGTIHAQSTAFTDPKTGIEFQQVTREDYSFGIALDKKSTTDFIGRISGKGTQGWSGVSLGGPMAKSLMVVAWPHEKKIVASLRNSQGYTSPGPNLNTSISLKTIPAGTSVDDDSYTYTFLCKGCILTDGSTFKAEADSPSLGFGYSTAAISSPGDSFSIIPFHSAFGLFQTNHAAAKSQKFATWAATAKEDSQFGARPGGAVPPPTSGPATVSDSAFDYIVVGSGPAGIVAAQRLTETGRSVLLLERGGPATAATGGKRLVPWNSSLTYYDVPGLFFASQVSTLGEGFCTDTAGLAGCILGGGSSVNGMAFIHPPSWDFDDRWPEGWKSSDIAPAAARVYARNPGTTTPSNDGKHYDQGIYNVLEEFFKPNGWNYADSIQSPNDKNHSYGHPALNIVNGLRGGPVVTYLPLAMGKPNFKLQLKTKVIRVVREGSKMTGVEVETPAGRREIINLRPGGSVVLAAGVGSTPRLLFHSGIGRPEQINSVKSYWTTRVTLPPQRDWISLPVGYDVQDHSRYMLMFNVTGGMQAYTSAQISNPTTSDKEMFLTGSGVLSQSFMRMDIFRRIKTSNGHDVFFQAHCAAPFFSGANQIELTLLLTHGSTSKGQMGLSIFGSTVFDKQPYVTTDTDKEAWTLMLNELMDMTRKPGSRLVYSGGRDTTAANILRTPVQQGVHFAGGAKMGTDDGRKAGGTAVVDLNTKVYGTDNLFVVDASFHPDLATGNSQALVMIAAEHAVKKIIALG